jgi:hypothetical protein
MKAELKTYCHKSGWSWDHPFPGDVGEDGRWELSLYRMDDLTEAGYVGYVALAQLKNGHWAVIFTMDEEGVFGFTRKTLGEAKHTLDALLGASTPEIPADRDAADPWLGDEALHQQILSQMRYWAKRADDASSRGEGRDQFQFEIDADPPYRLTRAFDDVAFYRSDPDDFCSIWRFLPSDLPHRIGDARTGWWAMISTAKGGPKCKWHPIHDEALASFEQAKELLDAYLNEHRIDRKGNPLEERQS